MMKRMTKCLLALLLLCTLALTLPAMAVDRHVADEAYLLDDSEVAALDEKAAAVSDKYGIAVFVATLKSLDGGDVVDTADLMLESTNVENGILLLISMEERDYAISTMGSKAIWYFSDANLAQGWS